MKKIDCSSPKIELSMEQKLWLGGKTFLSSIRPVILYTCLPALFMTIGMIFMRGRTSEEIIAESGNFYHALGVIVTVYILHKHSKKRGSSLEEDATLEYKALDKRKLLVLLFMGLGFGFFFSALVTVIPLPAFLKEGYQEASGGITRGSDQILALASTAILAPITEEIVFRGYMFNRLLSWFEDKASILIVTTVFALCHVSPIWIVYAFVMGLLLAKISMKEDNIAYSIALHIGFNTNVVPIWIISQFPTLERVVFANHAWIALYGAAACYGAAMLYKKYRKGNETW